MTFTVFVERSNGHFTAELVGAPRVRAGGPTRETALAELREVILNCMHGGELTTLDVEPPPGMTGLYGKYADDPALLEICEEAYRLRDQEIAEMDA